MQVLMVNLVKVFQKKGQSSARWTMTMMRGEITVPQGLKEHGGTVRATTQTWMVSILRGSMKALEMVLIGTTGRDTIIH